MSRIVYVNGEYLPEENAKVSVFDRGFLFADGVYEVTAVIGGKLIDNEPHLKRLRRSLGEINMASPADDSAIEEIQKELIKRNEVEEGAVYLQVTRGAADRDFAFPKETSPSLILFTQKIKIIDSPAAEVGLKILTTQDLRWARRDIKTVALLPASMAKMTALANGADDAWLVDSDGNVTEGSSFNAYIINDKGKIITRNLTNDILSGITRRAVLKLAAVNDLEVIERPFSVEEAYEAREAFATAASFFVMPIVKIDDTILGDGTPGQTTTELRRIYIEMALNQVERQK